MPGTDGWLSPDRGGVPHLLDLPTLLSASERIERDEETAAELRALLRGASSLGGARPKAHVAGQDGRIAVRRGGATRGRERDSTTAAYERCHPGVLARPDL